MDVMFDLSMEGHWVVLYDPDLVQADVAHEALVFEDGLPPAAPDPFIPRSILVTRLGRRSC